MLIFFLVESIRFVLQCFNLDHFHNIFVPMKFLTLQSGYLAVSHTDIQILSMCAFILAAVHSVSLLCRVVILPSIKLFILLKIARGIIFIYTYLNVHHLNAAV